MSVESVCDEDTGCVILTLYTSHWMVDYSGLKLVYGQGCVNPLAGVL